MEQALTESQLNEFKRRLKERYRALREEIRSELLKSDDEQYIELAGRVHDVEEEAVADLLVDLNLAGIDRHVQEIRDIDAALIRIAEGSYGICIDCEQPIDAERLTVYPTAKRCLQCQQVYERTHLGPGSPSL
ncbi:MAG: TraR/DksA family transcriptional regulator [Methylohalobius sp.]|nr:TraR/DksA family transcriptional regulator [Methylohalobius sp.]